jgi:hypothetical protein
MTNPNPDNAPIAPGQLPEDTIYICPTSVNYIYFNEDGVDWIGLAIDDHRLGPVLATLEPGGAAHISRSLAGLLRNLPRMRSEWVATNGGTA